jgi:hypothetical protein
VDLNDHYPFEPSEYRWSLVLKRLRDSTAQPLSFLLWD